MILNIFNQLIYITLMVGNIFFNNTIINNMMKKILILYRATMHYEPDMIELFKKYNSYYILIHPG